MCWGGRGVEELRSEEEEELRSEEEAWSEEEEEEEEREGEETLSSSFSWTPHRADRVLLKGAELLLWMEPDFWLWAESDSLL